MNSSTAIPPPGNNVAIPGNSSDVALSDIPIARSSGAVYSTINDLTKLGVGILNSTLLPLSTTHRWLKPLTHTDRLQFSVGAPWEIIRFTHPESGVVTDIYTKSGDSGVYSSFLVLIPDFDAGFSILSTSTSELRLTLLGLVGDLIVETVLPALRAQSIEEAGVNYIGTYESTVEGLNTTLTLCLNKTEGAPPGLVISNFISNGTDVIAKEVLPNRLVPTISSAAATEGKIAFRAVGQADAPREPTGYLSGVNQLSWFGLGAGTYGNVDIGLFVFELDEQGKATAVTIAGFRVRLVRAG